MSGDGYLAYHEFLLRFSIRPKPLEQAQSFDKQLRTALLDKFNNITDAFVGLDMDYDNRLNRTDFIQGFLKHKIWVCSPRHTALVLRLSTLPACPPPLHSPSLLHPLAVKRMYSAHD